MFGRCSFPLALLLSLLGIAPAAAQPSSTQRVFLAVNGGIQTATSDFADNITFGDPSFGPEHADFDARYATDRDRAIDVSGGVQVWRMLAVGGGVTQFTHADEAAITARLPHPFHFGQHRTINGSGTDLARKETAVHLQAMAVLPVAEGRSTVSLFAGPTFFTVDQDLVSAIRFEQTFPYDDARFVAANHRRRSSSATGFHAGADVAFYFIDRIGVGGTVRFSQGSADLASEDGGTVAIKTGGVHATGGLRIRF